MGKVHKVDLDDCWAASDITQEEPERETSVQLKKHTEYEKKYLYIKSIR